MWKVPNDVCANTVYEAIKAGVRMFDSSSDYGNEHESGKGLKRALDEGLVKREELFIVSKLWNTYKVGRREGWRCGCSADGTVFSNLNKSRFKSDDSSRTGRPSTLICELFEMRIVIMG